MGRQAYPIIGGIIGAVGAFFISGGTLTVAGFEAGFAIGAAIGGIAGSYIDPILLQGNKIGDTNIQVAAEGGTRAIMYGRACVTSTCIVARGNRKIVKKKQSNGKGSSGSTQNETVTWTFAIALGEAIVGGSISRIWQDENLVYDVLGDGAISADDNAKFGLKFRFYDGAETQLPDPDLQVFLGDDTPYFRGTAYVVFPNFDLTATGERIPVFKFEVLDSLAGVVSELETLEWDLPDTGPGLVPSSQSVTLSGSPDVLWNVDLFFSGDMETRDYAHVTERVGGFGRFVIATNSDATSFGVYNIYRITISDPPQTYYMNSFLEGETAPGLANLDGSSDWKLSVQVRGNATIEYYANPVDGFSAFGPQHGTAKASITSIAEGYNTTMALSEVAGDLMLRASMHEDQFDVSALTDQIAGVCVQTTVSGADALNAVVQPFFADPTERDGVLMYVKRGAPVLRTLTVDDLTEEPDVASRENVIEYPAKLHFFYQSPLTGYSTTKATSYRYSEQADSSGEGSVTTPVTFYDPNIPAQMAQKLHKVMWTEAEGSFTWKVGIHCIDLLPGDCVGLFLRGIATRARILATEYDGGSITLTMIKDRQSSYTSVVTAIPLPLPTPPDKTTMSKSVLAVMDIAALLDTDDQLIYYTAISGSTNIWNGAQLQRSLDGGSTWNPIGNVTTDCTMGKLTVAMTDADTEYTDTTNVVTVQLFDNANEILAQNDVSFLQEQGAIAVQAADGSWELMQYRDVVDEGNGLWTLSYLQRGRLNSPTSTHPIGALFVLLDTNVVKNAAQSSFIGATIKHRAVSFDTSPEDATVVTITYEGESQIEWSPASASAAYDGSIVGVTDIVPRHRFGTEINPIASVNFTGFRVTATNGTSTVTADTTGNSAYMTLSSAPTSVTVAALNKITGAGPAITITDIALVQAGSLVPEAVVNAGGGA